MITCFLIVIEKELVSLSAERQKEIEKQEITTSLSLQPQERDEQIEELNQNLKGKYYRIHIITWSE